MCSLEQKCCSAWYWPLGGTLANAQPWLPVRAACHTRRLQHSSSGCTHSRREVARCNSMLDSVEGWGARKQLRPDRVLSLRNALHALAPDGASNLEACYSIDEPQACPSWCSPAVLEHLSISRCCSGVSGNRAQRCVCAMAGSTAGSRRQRSVLRMLALRRRSHRGAIRPEGVKCETYAPCRCERFPPPVGPGCRWAHRVHQSVHGSVWSSARTTRGACRQSDGRCSVKNS